jgi:hypothetical protein
VLGLLQVLRLLLDRHGMLPDLPPERVGGPARGGALSQDGWAPRPVSP